MGGAKPMSPFGPHQRSSYRPSHQIKPPNLISSRPFNQLSHPLKQSNQQTRKSATDLMSIFQTSDGNIDFEKISGTVQQLGELYGTFSPIITRFIKR